jgi:peroxiredoxin
MENLTMAKQSEKKAFGQIIFGLLIIVSLVAIISGCKKEPAPQTPSEESRAETSLPEPEFSKPAARPLGGLKMSLVDVIKSAKTWGPSFPHWLGQPAPDFVLTDISGRQHRLSDYRGKDVMLIFWASWCSPCRVEIPGLIELRDTVGQDKLAMLAISYISPINSLEMIRDFVAENKINYTVLAAKSSDMSAPYNLVDSIPSSFFINPQGKIKLATIGLLTLSDIKAILQAE